MKLTVLEALVLLRAIDHVAKSLVEIPLQTSLDMYENFLRLQRALLPSDEIKKKVTAKYPETKEAPLTDTQKEARDKELMTVNETTLECDLITFTVKQFGPDFKANIPLSKSLRPVIVTPEEQAAELAKKVKLPKRQPVRPGR